jgi:hypothetical protein
LGRIRDYILTEENLGRLTILVNNEIRESRAESESRQIQLASQLADKQKRLDNLYDSLETRELTVADLAPRIKKLREEIERLDLTSKGLVQDVPELTLSEQDVRAAVRSLRVVLERGTTAQRKQFLRSFVYKIEYQHPRVTIYYKFPLRPDSDDGGYLEQLIYIGKGQKVLCIDKPGSSGRTRTYNPPVNRGLPCCCWELRIVADSFIVLHLPILPCC